MSKKSFPPKEKNSCTYPPKNNFLNKQTKKLCTLERTGLLPKEKFLAVTRKNISQEKKLPMLDMLYADAFLLAL